MKNSLKVAPSNINQLTDLVKTIQALSAENEKIEEIVSQLEQESPSRRVKRKIKNLVLTSASRFTGHGISNMLSVDSSLARLAWILLLTTSFIACCLYITNSLTGFLAYDVISNKKVQIQNEMIFPAVIICAWNSDFPIDTIIIHCTFNGQDCQSSSSTHFEKVSILGYGLLRRTYCIKFNRNRLLSVNKAGYELGLSASFLMPSSLQMYYGVFENFAVIRSDEIARGLSPGKGYIISVKKKISKRLPEPYNDCVENVDNSLSAEIAKMGSEYRQDLCYGLCILYYMEKTCECSLPSQFGRGGNDTCSAACVQTIIDTFDFQKNCRLCPKMCSTVVYDLKITPEKLDNYGHFYSKIENKLNKTKFEEITQRLVAFNINFESLSTETIEEMPKRTVANLIADLGGTFGVFLGLSVASFLEIIEVICKIFYILVKNL